MKLLLDAGHTARARASIPGDSLRLGLYEGYLSTVGRAVVPIRLPVRRRRAYRISFHVIDNQRHSGTKPRHCKPSRGSRGSPERPKLPSAPPYSAGPLIQFLRASVCAVGDYIPPRRRQRKATCFPWDISMPATATAHPFRRLLANRVAVDDGSRGTTI